MTSKQRAYLKSLAMTMDPIFQIGKGKPDTRKHQLRLQRHWQARELIKISVLQNCMDDPKELAQDPGRTHPFTGCTGYRQKDRSL